MILKTLELMGANAAFNLLRMYKAGKKDFSGSSSIQISPKQGSFDPGCGGDYINLESYVRTFLGNGKLMVDKDRVSLDEYLRLTEQIIFAQSYNRMLEEARLDRETPLTDQEKNEIAKFLEKLLTGDSMKKCLKKHREHYTKIFKNKDLNDDGYLEVADEAAVIIFAGALSSTTFTPGHIITPQGMERAENALLKNRKFKFTAEDGKKVEITAKELLTIYAKDKRLDEYALGPNKKGIINSVKPDLSS